MMTSDLSSLFPAFHHFLLCAYLLSLPIFWVAVLLKEFMAIQFNNFLSEPNIPIKWMAAFSIFIGIFWSSLFGGERKRFWSVFGGAFATSLCIILMGLMLMGYGRVSCGLLGRMFWVVWGLFGH